MSVVWFIVGFVVIVGGVVLIFVALFDSWAQRQGDRRDQKHVMSDDPDGPGWSPLGSMPPRGPM